MSPDKQRIQEYLKAFNFKPLFTEELGWDHIKEHSRAIPIDGRTYLLHSVAQKRGMVVYVCDSDEQSKLPETFIRGKIEKAIAKLIYEHIIIYTNILRDQQVWQWVRREPGRPIARREYNYYKGKSNEPLIQKIQAITFDISEEENIYTAQVTGRVRQAFDVDRVTKRFYDRFKSEHAAFLRFIEGITSNADREWYASLMLNRLMFIYFIQKKGFLDNNANYLSNRLRMMQERKSRDTFLSFYRYFLLRLFHEGLGKQEHSPELDALLGKVPYLNGGLFEVHELEHNNPNIRIPDEAFERIFAFFDAYQWHLDDRPLRADNEINPDVLGYIFEKYINQKQMGAYYTKEDITEYISKNTIIPFLLNAAEEKCLIAFRPDGSPWQLLKENPDRYIYDAVKKGVELPLPPEIEAGMQDVSKRSEWNKPAPEAYALPSEIWREVITRRQRCQEIRATSETGEVHCINDLITYNLDIRQFAQDVIDNSEGPELLRAFYNIISNVTVLDPTCGSGAFLFSALNILEPLYEACLDHMQIMIEERDRLDMQTESYGRKISQPGLSDFRTILKEVEQHPNRRYFILKSIIINNLYGVDLMEEATEICKLRLFLKLVAQIERVEDIEPLPDIDFNIRAGNTLVGFASYDEVEKAINTDMRNALVSGETMRRIEQKAQEVERGFENFRVLQTEIYIDSRAMTDMKRQLRGQLNDLNAELNVYLAELYGIDEHNISQKSHFEAKFEQWQQSHQPFHWFVEFYGIMKSGGFDVIIGNPPYLELREVNYTIQHFKCRLLSIHALCIERSLQLLQQQGCMSMIVPLALVSTQRMKIVQELLEAQHNAWYSNYSWRPGKLFDTVNRALTIFLITPSTQGQTFSTNYQKWTSDNRYLLMSGISYTEVSVKRTAFWIPKLSYQIENFILAKLLNVDAVLGRFIAESNYRLYYRTTGGLYWKIFTDFPPSFKVNGEEGHSTRETWFSLPNEIMVYTTIAILSSNVFWWWYTITTNCRDLNPYDIQNFSVSETMLSDPSLIELGRKYLEDIRENSTMLVRNQKQTGHTETQSFKIQKSKPIIDEIDRVLARHYNLTDEELDFIINYDIKYRVGRENGEDDTE